MFKLLTDTFNTSIVSILIVILFVFTIVKGSIQYSRFNYVFRDIKFYINIFSIYVVYLSYNFIAYELYYFILKILDLQKLDYSIWGSILRLVLFFIMFSIYTVAFRFIYKIFFRNMIIDLHKILLKLPIAFRSIIFGMLKIPKAIVNILAFVLILSTFSTFINGESSLVNIINSSTIYSNLSDKVISPIRSNLNNVISNIFGPIFDTFKSINTTNVRYLYNGVTIDEATMSNEEIENFAVESTNGIVNSYDRAMKLYDEVVNMLEYDDEKSDDIFNNDFSNLSGAISAFQTKKGICFDYASLYSALAEVIELPTRIVVGQGFDGSNWTNHAWNEVYIDETDEWIQVDTTFGETGNYFDIDNFEQDHRRERIIWEFSV